MLYASDHAINPRAILRRIRNTKRGMRVRSKIIKLLSEKGGMTTAQIAKGVGLSSSGVRRHLKNMMAEGILKSTKGKQAVWRLTGAGQMSIDELQA